MSKVEVTLSPIRLWAFLLVDLCIPLDYGNQKFDFMFYWSDAWIREPLCSKDNAWSARLHFWHCLKRKHCLFTNSWEQGESNAILWLADIPEDRRPTSYVPSPLSTEVNVISLLQFMKFKYRSITRGVWLNKSFMMLIFAIGALSAALWAESTPHPHVPICAVDSGCPALITKVTCLDTCR